MLQILQDNQLYLKPEKCYFHQENIDYLGLRISQNTITMDPVKVKGVMEWPVLKDKKSLQSFIGFVNFY